MTPELEAGNSYFWAYIVTLALVLTFLIVIAYTIYKRCHKTRATSQGWYPFEFFQRSNATSVTNPYDSVNV